MSYYVQCCVYVERFEPDEGQEVGDWEKLDTIAVASTPLVDVDLDVELLFDDGHIPKEPGGYAIMYSACMTGYKDYWGEYDIDVDVQWTQTVPLSKKEVNYLLGVDSEFNPDEPTFTLVDDLTEQDKG